MGKKYVPYALAVRIKTTLTLGITIVLVGCQFTQYTQTQQTPEFVVSVTLDPFPSGAGTELDVYATLRQDRQGVSRCRVRFSSRPVGAEPSTPENVAWVDAPEQGRSGVYRTRAVMFKTNGDWEIHTGMRCLGRERFVVFNYTVGTPIEE